MTRMRPRALLLVAAVFVTLVASASDFAQGLDAPDVALSDTDLSFSRLDPVQGEPFVVFARVRNIGDAAANATVRFYLGDVPADWSSLGERNVSVLPGGSSIARANLTLSAGTHRVSAQALNVTPWDADPGNQFASVTIEVFQSRQGAVFSSPTLLLERANATTVSGATEVLSLNVTARGGRVLGASLEVLDASGVPAVPAGPPIDVEQDTTVRLNLRIVAPELVTGTNRSERTLLVHAVAVNARGNTVTVGLTVFAAPIGSPRGSDPWMPAAVAVSLGLVGVFAAVASVETWRHRFLLLLLPLYTRLRKEGVLDQYTRGKIHGYVLANPGDYFTAISRALGIPGGSLAYHLRVLEREGQVVSRQDGVHRKLYPKGARVDGDEGSELSAVQQTVCRTIAETPGIKQKDIASLVGVSAPTINYHLRRLIARGFVRGVRRGMAVRYFSAQDPPPIASRGKRP